MRETHNVWLVWVSFHGSLNRRFDPFLFDFSQLFVHISYTFRTHFVHSVQISYRFRTHLVKNRHKFNKTDTFLEKGVSPKSRNVDFPEIKAPAGSFQTQGSFSEYTSRKTKTCVHKMYICLRTSKSWHLPSIHMLTEDPGWNRKVQCKLWTLKLSRSLVLRDTSQTRD